MPFALLGFVLAAVLLAVLALAGRRLPGPGAADRAGWLDVPLALLLGLLVASLGAWWLGPQSLEGGAVTGADFQEYCASVASLRGEATHHYAMRSRFPALLPALLAEPLGVVDGLLISSLLGAGLLGAGLYGWGLALHGRLAGLCAALLALALPPLALAGRVASFYPLITGLLVAASAAAALALRSRRPAALLLGGVGVALALLADGIGLIWALPCLALVLAAALRAPRSRWPLRLALVLLPVLLSWGVGRWSYAPTHPLELQLAIMVRTNQGGGPGAPIEAGSGGYRWGWSNPLAVPSTLWRVARSSGQAGEQLRHVEQVSEARGRHVAPWLPLLAAAVIPAALALRRRPWRLAALVVGCLPFAAMFQRAASMETNLRFLLLSMPFVPLLLGLALAWSLEGPLPTRDGPAPAAEGVRWHGLWRPLVAVLLLAISLLGPGWTPLSPRWASHQPFRAVNDLATAVSYARTGQQRPNPVLEPCIQALRQDAEKGISAESRLFGELIGPPHPP
jgi:hypothetical protein